MRGGLRGRDGRGGLRGRDGQGGRDGQSGQAVHGADPAGGRLPGGGRYGRGAPVPVTVDGAPRTAHLGETVATVLLSEGLRVWRESPAGAPRGLYCGIGLCSECLVQVDGVPGIRACVEPVRAGMDIRTGTDGTEGDGDAG